MIKNDRLFLVEPNELVAIRDDLGREVSFRSKLEFQGYSGVTIPEDVVRADFEPKRGILYMEFADPGNPSIPVPQASFFENIISNIASYLALLDDEFFNVTLEEAKEIKQRQVDSILVQAKQNAHDSGTEMLDPGGLQSMEEMLTLALIAKALGDTGWTIDVILATDNPDGSAERVTLDVDTVISKIAAIKQRNENYNQIAQNHKDAITLLTTVQEIKDYVLPTV